MASPCLSKPSLGLVALLCAASLRAWAQDAPSAPSVPATPSDPAAAESVQNAAPTPPPEIRVFGRSQRPGAEKTALSPLSDAPAAETPLSVSVLRAGQLRDAGAGGLSNAMRGETSVSDAYNTLGYIESLQIRGFLLSNSLNYRREGLPTSNHAPIAFENKESIEILKGVAGLQSGEGSPGGAVHYVVKKPTDTPLRELYLGLSERGSQLLHLDTGGRSGVDQAVGYRFNLASEKRRPMADNAPGERHLASAYVDLRLPKAYTLSAEMEYHHSSQVSVPGWSLLDANNDGEAESVPSAQDPRINLNNQSWTQPFVSKAFTASTRLEQRLHAQSIWGVQLGHQRVRTDDRIAFPDGCGTVYPGMCANHDVDLYDYRSENEVRRTDSAQLYGRTSLSWGPVRHQLSASLLHSDYREDYPEFQAYNWVGTINAINPTPVPGDGTLSTRNTLQKSRTQQLMLGDVMRFDQAWSLWLGLRQSWLERSSVKTDGSEATAYSQNFTTPYVALSKQLSPSRMVYGAYSEGIETEVVPNRPLDFSNAGQALPAAKSQQWELGYKQTLPRAGLVTAALFDIEKPSAIDVDDGALSRRIANGKLSRHRGLELLWTGRPTALPNLRVQAQMTYLDAKVIASQDASLVGKDTPNVPPLTASLLLAYTFENHPHVTWSNRIYHSGARKITAENIAQIDAYQQWDTALTWDGRLGTQKVTWRGGIDNVLDRRFWKDAPTQSWGGTYLFPAPPRTFRLSAQLSF